MKKTGVIIGLVLLIATALTVTAQDTISLKKKSVLEELCNPRLAEAVMQWVGTPYRMGGCSEKGTDCSCLVRSIVRAAYGVELSRSSRSMYQEVSRLDKKDEYKEGDLLFFRRGRRISHVGIYLRDGWYVHASTREGVVVRRLDKKSRRLAFYCAGRIKSLPEYLLEQIQLPLPEGDAAQTEKL